VRRLGTASLSGAALPPLSEGPNLKTKQENSSLNTFFVLTLEVGKLDTVKALLA
jgi:hypothetical protein